jgi:ABC-type Fe3+/spermidine/putrescine transport system ATPase subunit
VMNAGRLEQVGAPAEIYDRPRTRFVAGFIGDINLIAGTVQNGRFVTLENRALPAPVGPEGSATLALRPERVLLGPPGEGPLEGTVADASFLGDQVIYTITLGNDRRIVVKERNAGGGALRAPGSAVGLSWSADAGVLVGDR